MHVRFSTCRGLPVFDDHAGEVIGLIDGVLLHPDEGRVEGFFVRVPRFLFSSLELFLPALDIIHWGLKVTVRSGDVLGPPEEFLRIAPLLADRRPIVGQHIQTQSGRLLGRCRDVQWNSKTFMLEWLFPKRWLSWKLPVPASEILEVRRDAIIIRDPAAAVPQPAAGEEKQPLLPVLPEVVEGITQTTV